MQVSHVEKNNEEKSSPVPNSQSIKGVLKPYLGLHLIDPESSYQFVTET